MFDIVEKSGISKSKWISELIHEKTSTTWPENVRKLAGAWKDLPSARKSELKWEPMLKGKSYKNIHPRYKHANLFFKGTWKNEVI